MTSLLKKNQMAQLERLSVQKGAFIEKMNLSTHMKDGCIKTRYDCIAGIDHTQRSSLARKEKVSGTQSQNGCAASQ